MTAPVLSPDELSKRVIPVEGTSNLRDVGGYATAHGKSVRWRTLFRSDALDRLDSLGWSALAELGVRTVIDLREHDEVAQYPNRPGDDLRVIHHPIYRREKTPSPAPTGPWTLDEVYLRLVEDRPDTLVAAVRLLAESDTLPAVVHCTGGKDRTGMVIALVLSFLGVDDEVVAADFSVSEQLLSAPDLEERMAVLAQLSDEQRKMLLSSDPALILSFLDRIRAVHGDITTFLLANGMTEVELSSLRDHLVTSEGSKEQPMTTPHKEAEGV